MNRRWLFAATGAAVSLQISALVAACAAEGEDAGLAPEDLPSPIPSPTLDGSTNGDVDSDGGCTGSDCEYYPAECTNDALCFGGLFDPSDPERGVDLRTHVMALAARSPNDAWLAGALGQLAHFDGTTWSSSKLGTQQSLSAIWLHGDAQVAFDDPRRLYTRGLDAGADAAVSADGWSFFGSATISGSWRNAAVAVSWAHPDATMLWVGVRGRFPSAAVWRLRRSESGTFTFSTIPLAPDSNLQNREIFGLHGTSPNEVWAVGSEGVAVRIADAESAAPIITPYNALTMVTLDGVWAAASNDVWAVGATGTVRRYRGDPRFWEIYEDLPTKQHLRAIAGSSPSDIWIVGDEATAFHFDGATWTRVKIAGLGPRRPRLEHVWVPSPGKVWIAGQGVLVSLGGKP